MSHVIERLVAASGGPLGPDRQAADGVPAELIPLLDRSNGFYAFESALHVYPSRSAVAGRVTLSEWNVPAAWRESYRDLVDRSAYFFAEDIFGNQFALIEGNFVGFEPETGEIEILAASAQEWAAVIVADWRQLTGFVTAHDWQSAHGALAEGYRLLPRQPFVLGGEFSVDNLQPVPAAAGMRVRAELALQIRDRPDGSKIQYHLPPA